MLEGVANTSGGWEHGVDEPRRIELFERLSAIVGAEVTHTLFELLPRRARKRRQVDHGVSVLREVVGVVREEVGVLRRDVDGLRVQIVELGACLTTSHHELTATMHQEITRALIVQTRTTVFSMVTALVATQRRGEVPRAECAGQPCCGRASR